MCAFVYAIACDHAHIVLVIVGGVEEVRGVESNPGELMEFRREVFQCFLFRASLLNKPDLATRVCAITMIVIAIPLTLYPFLPFRSWN